MRRRASRAGSSRTFAEPICSKTISFGDRRRLILLVLVQPEPVLGDQLDVVHDSAVGASSSLELLAGACSLGVMNDAEHVDELREDVHAVDCIVSVSGQSSDRPSHIVRVRRSDGVGALCYAADLAGRARGAAFAPGRHPGGRRPGWSDGSERHTAHVRGMMRSHEAL